MSLFAFNSKSISNVSSEGCTITLRTAERIIPAKLKRFTSVENRSEVLVLKNCSFSQWGICTTANFLSNDHTTAAHTTQHKNNYYLMSNVKLYHYKVHNKHYVLHIACRLVVVVSIYANNFWSVFSLYL